jgi:DnaJ-class molecular chaperone
MIERTRREKECILVKTNKVCPLCDGEGIISSKDDREKPCPDCKGKGILTENRDIISLLD